MNRSLLLALAAIFLAPLLAAQSPDNAPPAPPPVVQLLPRAVNPIPQPGMPQRSYGPSGDTLISRQNADGILEGFKKAYGKTDGAPRVVIYVNRALVDTASGFKLTARTENFEKTDTTLKTAGTNTYKAKVPPPPSWLISRRCAKSSGSSAAPSVTPAPSSPTKSSPPPFCPRRPARISPATPPPRIARRSPISPTS